MTQQTILRLAACGVATVGLVVLFSIKPGPRHGTAADVPADHIDLRGVVRDFRSNHADFGIVPVGGYGHYAGCVGKQLSNDGHPVFVGAITDTRTITNFQITEGGVITTQPFAAMVTLLGSAIETSHYHIPTTMKVHVGAQTFEIFGPFNNPITGNVNDNQSATGYANPGSNPRAYVFPTVFPANTAVTITGRSWERNGSGGGSHVSDWQEFMTNNSHVQSQQVRVLRNGDPVPNVPGLNQQASIAQYVRDFVNTSTNTMKMLDNQAIYLFEVGTNNMSSAAADFQDLVVLVTLARDPTYLNTLDVFGHETAASHAAGSGFKVQTQWMDRTAHPIAPHVYHNPAEGTALDACGRAINDLAGIKGALSTGGITSANTFDQWYRDSLGTNLSDFHTIRLTRDHNGVYVYSTNDFHPVDGKLLGNEGAAHNFHFTYAITAEFVYHTCGRQFFEFAGSDDTWLFIGGKLVMDRGGIIPNTWQHVDLDRLGLVDGQTYDISFFYGQRQSMQSDFHMRTNIFMSTTHVDTVTGGYD